MGSANAAVKTVHVAFKTHLDIGFTDLASNVVRRYLDEFIPQAIARAAETRLSGAGRFVWTVGSWLIYEFLEKADARRRRQMEAAIEGGDIAWHALPFTTHTELMDAELFRVGLSLSRELDRRFGRRTIAAKMTDVPGHTRAMLPLLAEAGVRMLHIGVNPVCRPPSVPRCFLWKQGRAEVVVVYSKQYGATTVVPGLPHGLVIAFTGDNMGPQTPARIQQVFDHQRGQFPHARIVGSRLDDFASPLWQHRRNLPVLTQEIGDTWIHGLATDPLKVAGFRALNRLHQRWLGEAPAADDNRRGRFARQLLLVAEHTWGLDEKTHLADYKRYRGRPFQALRDSAKGRHFEASWQEQRNYLTQAVTCLGRSKMAAEARAALAECIPETPDCASFRPVEDYAASMDVGQFVLQINPDSGAIQGLHLKGQNRRWASTRHSLGLFRYQTFSQADYDRFLRQYTRNLERHADWAIPDLTKPGIVESPAVSRFWNSRLTKLLRHDSSWGTKLLLELRLPPVAVKDFGAPGRVTLQISCPAACPELHFDLRWFSKKACRLPEASWFSFSPLIRSGGRWTIEKMGCPIDPRDVVSRGGRTLHAVGEEMAYEDSVGRIVIHTLDAPLVAPGRPSLLDFTNRLPSASGGMHINLHNNVWGTNFPMWYENDARFRFKLSFG